MSLVGYVLCESDMVKLKRVKNVVNVKHCWSSWQPGELPGMPADVKFARELCIKHGTAFREGNIT